MKGVYDKVIELASRRGFFWPSAKEVYADSPAGFYVYGPLGVRMKEKLISLWRREIVLKEEVNEIETPNILPIKVFEASGHLEHFFDKLIECKRCHSKFRIDKLLEETLGIEENLEGLPDSELLRMVLDNNLRCPNCGSSEWGELKNFNLMFTLAVGAETEGPNAALRPETTQGSVVEFRKTFMVARSKLPFALGQVGRVFRNEISPRRALIRMREFQQLEVQVFFDPNDSNGVYTEKLKPYLDYKLRFLRREDRESGKISEIQAREALRSGYTVNSLITYWLVLYQKFFNEVLGFPLERLRYRELIEGEKAHYSLVHWDLEVYTEDLGWVELVNNAYRTDYDLSGHMRVSGVDLRITNPEGSRKFLPHMYEPSIGVDRVIFHEIMLAYREDGERIWLQLPRNLAPIEVGVFPLLKRDKLPDKAKEIYLDLINKGILAFYDDSGTIGRRYRRMD
ncbi:MAG: glycine--tRNA ligase, partial [Candidatus Korarchaeum sp.]|nr:glycine--tRNA ligase [Candidatus Korarchaeum sp.]MDW8034871.1 glycine--tRNA ligase [Candidatus Korarchaeum sp.]